MSIRLDFSPPTGLPTTLPVLPLRRGVLLPGGVSSFAVGRPRSRAALDVAEEYILVAPQRAEVESAPGPADLLSHATLARVVDVQAGRRGALGVILQGIGRVLLTEFPSTGTHISAQYELLDETWPEGVAADAALEVLNHHLERAPTEHPELDPRLLEAMKAVDRPALLVDFIASLLEADDVWKKEILLTSDPAVRAEKVIAQYLRIKQLNEARTALEDRIRTENEDVQREAILRRQLKAIQDELNDGDDGDEVAQLTKKIAEAKLPPDVRESAEREIKRLGRMNAASSERNVALDWLAWIAEMPWDTDKAMTLDLDRLEAVLATSHYGLEEVKRQVVEHLAVRKLGGKGRADVLLLVGPPGVGKTSIGAAIAEATERKLVRVALGGMRDEAELRGHRRTYVGARPGRLIEGIRRAGTVDAVVLLDEIDKLGRSYQGDPSSALLEILDPEQNHAFVDHYLEVPYDLSKVLFIATANDLSQVPLALRDRLEIIEIDGYTADEKLAIAKAHLLDRLATQAGLAADDVELTDAAVTDAIEGWSREAGVRQLQRVLGKAFRAAAVKKARGDFTPPLLVDVGELPTYLGRRKFFDHAHDASDKPGIATGLAWTPMGGDVLYVEASTLPGNGKLTLTGQLGDVMKESARAALTYVLANGQDIGVAEDALAKRDVHIHVPAGGVPKDGPSAGVTMFTALASLLSSRPIASDVAMTGEATLRGRVLPVGGIKSKVLAAHRKGLKRVIIPKRNAPDLEDLPEQARRDMEFILVDEMSEVLASALSPATTPVVPKISVDAVDVVGELVFEPDEAALLT